MWIWGSRLTAMRMVAALLGIIAAILPCAAQDWRSYGGDPGGKKFSEVQQINRSNVTRLKLAWVYHTGDVSDGTKWPARSAFETTPLAVNGVLYLTTPFSRLIALDGSTGRDLWSFDPRIDRRQSTNLFVNRGAAYWSSGGKQRPFLGSIDGRLFSIVAETGRPDDSFGKGGWIDLRPGVAGRFSDRSYGMTSPPAIYKDLVICGSLVPDGEPLGPAGDVRAFDARTGKLVWTFHTVARTGEYGNNMWPTDGWRDRGGLNAWPPLSIDLKRGIVFLPLTSPSTDFYGGDRKGAGLFGDSLVALQADTGKRVWHFQTVHHNLWDYDLPAQPLLVQVRYGVAQVTKTGFTFVFDRMTGEPLFPVEETPAPPSKVPGEQTWPTQPRPLKPPPYAREKMRPDELTNVTPESRAYCATLVEGAAFGGIFTPIGLTPTVLFPGTNGGANWGGASFDPETHTLFVNSMDVGMLYHMVKRPDGSTIPYRPQGSGTPNSRFWDPDMLPCQKPPWGFLTAIDLDKGEFRWRSVLGVVDALVDKGLPPTGAPNLEVRSSPRAVWCLSARQLTAVFALSIRTRARNSGWHDCQPAGASPMTFLDPRSGRQFVVIAAGGGNKYNKTYSDSLVAYALFSGRDDSEPRVEYHRGTDSTVADSPHRNSPISAEGRAVFSHRRHAKLKLACSSCYATAETGVAAGLPPARACTTCHSSMPFSPSTATYKLPGFLFFSHARHYHAKIGCSACHGDVWTEAQPATPLKMAACVNCHRASRRALPVRSATS